MADNLTVSIGIDTKKLTADLAIAKQQLSQAGKDWQQAINRGAGTAEIEKLSSAYDGLRKQITATQRTLAVGYAAHGRAAADAAQAVLGLSRSHKVLEESTKGASREVFKLSREFGNLEVSSLNIAKAFREFPKVAVPIAVVGAAAAAAGKLADAAARNVTELNDLSRASGFAEKDIVALEKVFRGQNVEVTSLDQALRKAGESFDKYKAKAGDFSGGIVLRGGRGTGESGGVAVLRGGTQASEFAPGGTTILRGGQPFAAKPEEGLAGLLSPAQFKADAEGRRKWLEEAVKVLVNIQKTEPALAMQVARAEWGDQAEKILRGFRAGVQPGAMTQALGATAGEPRLLPEAGPRAEAFQVQQKEATEAATAAATRAGISGLPAATDALKRSTEGMKAVDDAIQHTRDNWDGLQQDISKGIDAQQSAENFEAGWTGVFNGILSAWQQTVAAINSTQPTTPGGGGGAGPAGSDYFGGPYATGGIVPGSGSGDTVPAWLTPGEFVNRKASVGYYGAGVFRALNAQMIPREIFQGFAYGGLVDSFHAPAHFADGGMVTGSSGGTPVHLHLGSREFITHAAPHIANALVKEARGQSMRSAGIKPSWVS